MSVSIRPFRPDEWALFRDLRLEALHAEPANYAGRHEDAAARSDGEWRAMLEAPGQAIFGLFEDETPIGLTAAFTWRDDPSGQSAIVTMGYVRKPWRGRGLSHTLHEATLGWIAAQSQFTRAIVGHRASNLASRGGIVAAGFAETHRLAHAWPDGGFEDEVFYERRVR